MSDIETISVVEAAALIHAGERSIWRLLREPDRAFRISKRPSSGPKKFRWAINKDEFLAAIQSRVRPGRKYAVAGGKA